MGSTLIISRARRGKPQRWMATERQFLVCSCAHPPSVTRSACISTLAPPPCRSRPRAPDCRCQLPSIITITFSAAYSHTRTRTRTWTRTCIQHMTNNTLRPCGWRAPRWRTPPGRRRPERHAAGCGRGTVGSPVGAMPGGQSDSAVRTYILNKHIRSHSGSSGAIQHQYQSPGSNGQAPAMDGDGSAMN